MTPNELFDTVPSEIPLEEVFEAYYECRRHKRGTINALKFEIDLEENLVQLWRDINSGTYEIGQSIAFIVNTPVKREIFAANFRDRIVHHLIIRRLMPFFEHTFIDASYSCRVGKGSLYAIFDVYRQIKEISKNWTQSCWVLKMDIQAFFMSIPKEKLAGLLDRFVVQSYTGVDKAILRRLIGQIVLHSPQHNCHVKGHSSDWTGLSFSKSLFRVPSTQGLPIGNLTSQIFANFYLNVFDHFIITHPARVGYGRYVDDFVLIHRNKKILKKMRHDICYYLSDHLNLKAHPQKIRLQSADKGVPFVGFYIKPHRIVCGRRIKGQMIGKIQFLNACVNLPPKKRPSVFSVCQTVNSYLGLMKHVSCFKLKRRLLNRLSHVWQKNVVQIGCQKIQPVIAHHPVSCMRQMIRRLM